MNENFAEVTGNQDSKPRHPVRVPRVSPHFLFASKVILILNRPWIHVTAPLPYPQKILKTHFRNSFLADVNLSKLAKVTVQ